MPIKRKDRENSNETNCVKSFRMDHIPTDHELFLQAFEKPTQIYRYLRSRNRLSPIFLHRNLTYMKERMSRNHNTRPRFSVNNLLDTITKRNTLEEEKNGAPNNYMTLLFLGFYNKLMVEEQYVEVEIVVSKIAQMKRKDSFKSKQDRLGSAIVKVNPVDMIGKVPAVSVPTELFKPAGTGLLNSSCILQLNTTVLPHFNSSNEPVIKSDQPARCFETELVIFDKHNRCTLSDGEYELTLTECTNTATPKIYSPKKHPTWEEIPEHCLDEFNKGENPLDDFTKCPTLKFRLSWTKDKYTDMVDRPLPITIRKDDFMTNAKENGSGGGIALNRSDSVTSSESNCVMNGNCTSNKTTTTSSAVAVASVATAPQANPNAGATSKANTSMSMSAKTHVAINSNGISQSMIVKLHDIASRIIYHFIYNNNSSQQTETFDNFNCPWCCLHCLNLYSLLKHLKLCHARFNFTYVPMPNGVRVDVSINELFDGSYIGSPHDLVGPAGSAFARAGPVRRPVVTRILVCRPRRPRHSLTEFLEIDENELNSQRPYVTGHNRLYHHTMTCLPVHPKGLDIDSEGETDPAWLQHKTMQMIDEFTDVNEGEKELMKMWNLHIMRNGYVGDIQIPLACEMFLDMKGKELLQKNLYKNFVLHLCNFFDYGLISPETLYKTIQKLQRILSTYNDGRDVMVDEHKKQLHYWHTVGVHKQRDLHSQPAQPKNIASSTNTYSFRSASHAKQNDSDDDDDDDEEDGPRSSKKRAGRSQSDDVIGDGDQTDNKHKKNSQTDLMQKSRNQTDLRNAAKETGKSERTSTGTKRKALNSRSAGNSTDSPPRRRSASAALQVASNKAFTVKRRNSTAVAQSSAPSAIKKGKRLSLSISKLSKIDK